MYGVKTFYSLKGCVDYANRNDYEIITIIPKRTYRIQTSKNIEKN